MLPMILPMNNSQSNPVLLVFRQKITVFLPNFCQKLYIALGGVMKDKKTDIPATAGIQKTSVIHPKKPLYVELGNNSQFFLLILL